MSHPQGTQSYRLDATGEEFYWSGTHGVYIFKATGIRVTWEELQQLRLRHIGPQQLFPERASAQAAQQPRFPGPGVNQPLPRPNDSRESNPATLNYAYINPNTAAGYESETQYSRNPQQSFAPTQSAVGQPFGGSNSNIYGSAPPPSVSTQSQYQRRPSQSQSQAPSSGRQPGSTSYRSHGSTGSSRGSLQGVPGAQAAQQQIGTGRTGPVYSTSNSASTGRSFNTEQLSRSSDPYIEDRRSSTGYVETQQSRSGNTPHTQQRWIPASTQASNVSGPDVRQEQLSGQLGRMDLQESAGSVQGQWSTGRDPSTHAYYRNFYGPPETVTDPELLKGGVSARMRISGTPGAVEEFDESYRIRKQPRKFFVQGKVFKILWSEPAGDENESVTEFTRDSRFGQNIHSKVRRFVVIREEEAYCSAMHVPLKFLPANKLTFRRPIMTYGNQGAGKRGVKKSDCAIIYTGKSPPEILPGERPRPNEAPMRPNAIRVDPDERGAVLLETSRVNFGKVYTIEHNVKVKSFGMVNRDSKRDLIYQFKHVWGDMLGAPLPAPAPHQMVPASGVAGSSNLQNQSAAPNPVQFQSREQLRAAITQANPRQPAGSVGSQPRSARSQRSQPSQSATSKRSAQRIVSKSSSPSDESDEDDESEHDSD